MGGWCYLFMSFFFVEKFAPNHMADNHKNLQCLWDICTIFWGIMRGSAQVMNLWRHKKKNYLRPIFSEIVFSTSWRIVIDRNGDITHNLGQEMTTFRIKVRKHDVGKGKWSLSNVRMQMFGRDEDRVVKSRNGKTSEWKKFALNKLRIQKNS